MAKRRTNPSSKTDPAAARKAAAALIRRRATVLGDLVQNAGQLERVDVERQRLLERRDGLVVQALDLDVSMVEVARVAGTSRQALMKRLPARPVAGNQPAFDL